MRQKLPLPCTRLQINGTIESEDRQERNVYSASIPNNYLSYLAQEPTLNKTSVQRHFTSKAHILETITLHVKFFQIRGKKHHDKTPKF